VPWEINSTLFIRGIEELFKEVVPIKDADVCGEKMVYRVPDRVTVYRCRMPSDLRTALIGKESCVSPCCALGNQ